MKIEEYFGTLLGSVDVIHEAHLAVDKHNTHIVLQEYYEEATELVDAIIEGYQGVNTVIKEKYVNLFADRKITTNTDAIAYFKEFVEVVRKGRDELFDKTYTENWALVDDLLILVDSMLYKLINLTNDKQKNEGHSIKGLTQYLYESMRSEKYYIRDIKGLEKISGIKTSGEEIGYGEKAVIFYNSGAKNMMDFLENSDIGTFYDDNGETLCKIKNSKGDAVIVYVDKKDNVKVY